VLSSFFVNAQQEKPVFKKISKDSVDAAKDVKAILLLANPSTDYSGYEFVSFDITIITNGLEYTITNNKTEFSIEQKALLIKAKSNTYVHIEHMKVRSSGSNTNKILKDVTFVIK
jgi:hypothetical protein